MPSSQCTVWLAGPPSQRVHAFRQERQSWSALHFPCRALAAFPPQGPKLRTTSMNLRVRRAPGLRHAACSRFVKGAREVRTASGAPKRMRRSGRGLGPPDQTGCPTSVTMEKRRHDEICLRASPGPLWACGGLHRVLLEAEVDVLQLCELAAGSSAELRTQRLLAAVSAPWNRTIALSTLRYDS